MAAVNGLAMYDKKTLLDVQINIEDYAPLVKRIAYHMMMRMPASVQVDDLIQAGMIGLIEASQKYDASRGASFETYAGIRIRGAIVDEMRRGDWVPRSVHWAQARPKLVQPQVPRGLAWPVRAALWVAPWAQAGAAAWGGACPARGAWGRAWALECFVAQVGWRLG